MKLSSLYTKDPISEVNAFKKLIGVAGKAFGRVRRNPNIRYLEVKRALDEVFQNVWASYSNNPKVQLKLDAYRTSSFNQHLPDLFKISDPVELRKEIWRLLKTRADRYVEHLNSLNSYNPGMTHEARI